MNQGNMPPKTTDIPTDIPPAQDLPPNSVSGSEAESAPAPTMEDFQRMVAEERAKWDEEQAEKERLAKLPADQRDAEEQRLRAEDLARREGDILKRELRMTACETLAQRGLPPSLADVLVYTDADSCQKSIDAVGKAFAEAVSQGVEERLRGKTPPGLPGMRHTDNLREIAANAIRGRN